MKVLEIHEVREVFETTDYVEVNRMLETGWILADMIRGNLKVLYVLVKG